MSTPFTLIGRVLLGLFVAAHGLIFLRAALDPQMLAGLSGYVTSRGVPQPQLVVYAIIAFEILAGLALVFGIMVVPVSIVLALWCFATAGVMHNFWALPPAQFSSEVAHFLKNIGLGGAFLLLAGDRMRAHVA